MSSENTSVYLNSSSFSSMQCLYLSADRIPRDKSRIKMNDNDILLYIFVLCLALMKDKE